MVDLLTAHFTRGIISDEVCIPAGHVGKSGDLLSVRGRRVHGGQRCCESGRSGWQILLHGQPSTECPKCRYVRLRASHSTDCAPMWREMVGHWLEASVYGPSRGGVAKPGSWGGSSDSSTVLSSICFSTGSFDRSFSFGLTAIPSFVACRLDYPKCGSSETASKLAARHASAPKSLQKSSFTSSCACTSSKCSVSMWVSANRFVKVHPTLPTLEVARAAVGHVHGRYDRRAAAARGGGPSRRGRVNAALPQATAPVALTPCRSCRRWRWRCVCLRTPPRRR